MITYRTFDLPRFLDVRSIDLLIGIIGVVSFAVIVFIYAHNTKTKISPVTGKEVVYKRPSDALPATSTAISVLGILTVLALFLFAPLYDQHLMASKIEKDYNVSVLAITKDHKVTVADPTGATYSCIAGSDDQIRYNLICAIPGGRMPLDWIMENKGK